MQKGTKEEEKATNFLKKTKSSAWFTPSIIVSSEWNRITLMFSFQCEMPFSPKKLKNVLFLVWVASNAIKCNYYA